MVTADPFDKAVTSAAVRFYLIGTVNIAYEVLPVNTFQKNFFRHIFAADFQTRFFQVSYN